MNIVRAQIESVEKRNGHFSMQNWNRIPATNPYFVLNVKHENMSYKVRSEFYVETGKYAAFDLDSVPNKNGEYINVGIYDGPTND